MSSSTPLNQLPSQQPQPSPQQSLTPSNNSDDMVDNILNEMSNNNGTNNDSLNYTMDPSQIPPEKMDVNFLESQNSNETLQVPNNNLQAENTNTNTKEVESNSMLSKLKLGNMEGMLNKCFSGAKSAVIIFILVVIVSLPQFNRVVFTKIPSMLSESGEINIKGIVLKGALCSILFLVSSMFI